MSVNASLEPLTYAKRSASSYAEVQYRKSSWALMEQAARGKGGSGGSGAFGVRRSIVRRLPAHTRMLRGIMSTSRSANASAVAYCSFVVKRPFVCCPSIILSVNAPPVTVIKGDRALYHVPFADDASLQQCAYYVATHDLVMLYVCTLCYDALMHA